MTDKLRKTIVINCYLAGIICFAVFLACCIISPNSRVGSGFTSFGGDAYTHIAEYGRVAYMLIKATAISINFALGCTFTTLATLVKNRCFETKKESIE